jgi:hypothetical protein
VSLSESDLRTALRHGEGDGLDPNAVLGRARAVRRRRRRTLAAVAGSVAAVAAIAVAGPLVLNSLSNGSGKSASANPAVSALESPPHISRPVAEPNPDISPSCPRTAPAVTVPSAADAAEAPVFPTPIERMLVCVFQAPRAAGVASTDLAARYTLTGPQAGTIADRLNALPASSGPDNTCAIGQTVVLIATDQVGHTEQAVAAAGCSGLIVTTTAWRSGARDVLLTLINKGLPQPFGAPHATIGPGPS